MESNDVGVEQPPRVGNDQLEAVVRHLPEPLCMHVCDGETGED